MRLSCPLLFRRSLYVATFCLLAPLASPAGTITANTPAITASPGDTGSFEISYSVPTGGSSSTLNSFSVMLTATATTATGLSFTGVSMATAPDAYVFAGTSGDVASGTAFSSDAFPNLSFTVADTDTDTSGQTIAAGDAFGLVQVSYSVDPNATAGAYTLTLDATASQMGSLTVLTPPSTFTILPTGVPEPNSAVGTVLAAAGALFAFVRVRRRRAAV